MRSGQSCLTTTRPSLRRNWLPSPVRPSNSTNSHGVLQPFVAFGDGRCDSEEPASSFERCIGLARRLETLVATYEFRSPGSERNFTELHRLIMQIAPRVHIMPAVAHVDHLEVVAWSHRRCLPPRRDNGRRRRGRSSSSGPPRRIPRCERCRGAWRNPCAPLHA
jgi:hypothetical protein